MSIKDQYNVINQENDQGFGLDNDGDGIIDQELEQILNADNEAIEGLFKGDLDGDGLANDILVTEAADDEVIIDDYFKSRYGNIDNLVLDQDGNKEQAKVSLETDIDGEIVIDNDTTWDGVSHDAIARANLQIANQQGDINIKYDVDVAAKEFNQANVNSDGSAGGQNIGAQIDISVLGSEQHINTTGHIRTEVTTDREGIGSVGLQSINDVKLDIAGNSVKDSASYQQNFDVSWNWDAVVNGFSENVLELDLAKRLAKENNISEERAQTYLEGILGRELEENKQVVEKGGWIWKEDIESDVLEQINLKDSWESDLLEGINHIMEHQSDGTVKAYGRKGYLNGDITPDGDPANVVSYSGEGGSVDISESKQSLAGLVETTNSEHFILKNELKTTEGIELTGAEETEQSADVTVIGAERNEVFMDGSGNRIINGSNNLISEEINIIEEKTFSSREEYKDHILEGLKTTLKSDYSLFVTIDPNNIPENGYYELASWLITEDYTNIKYINDNNIKDKLLLGILKQKDSTEIKESLLPKLYKAELFEVSRLIADPSNGFSNQEKLTFFNNCLESVPNFIDKIGYQINMDNIGESDQLSVFLLENYETTRANKYILRAAMWNSIENQKYIPEELANDYEIWLTVAIKDESLLTGLDEDLKAKVLDLKRQVNDLEKATEITVNQIANILNLDLQEMAAILNNLDNSKNNDIKELVLKKDFLRERIYSLMVSDTKGVLKDLKPIAFAAARHSSSKDAFLFGTSSSVSWYYDLLRKAVSFVGRRIEYINPEDVNEGGDKNNYYKLARTAVGCNGWHLRYINPEDVNIDENRNYYELAKMAVNGDAYYIKNITPEDVNIDEDRNYYELAKMAVNGDAYYIKNINPEDVNIDENRNYYELARMAVNVNSSNIKYINLEASSIGENSNYYELAEVAINYSADYIQYINPEYVNIDNDRNYYELAQTVINYDISNVQYIYLKAVNIDEDRNYYELAKTIINNVTDLIYQNINSYFNLQKEDYVQDIMAEMTAAYESIKSAFDILEIGGSLEFQYSDTEKFGISKDLFYAGIREQLVSNGYLTEESSATDKFRPQDSDFHFDIDWQAMGIDQNEYEQIIIDEMIDHCYTFLRFDNSQEIIRNRYAVILKNIDSLESIAARDEEQEDRYQKYIDQRDKLQAIFNEIQPDYLELPESDNRPLCLITYPDSDYNGAFNNHVLDDYTKQYRLVYYDVRTDNDWLEKIYESTANIGDRVELFFIGGHGSQHSLSFGSNSVNNYYQRPYQEELSLNLSDLWWTEEGEDHLIEDNILSNVVVDGGSVILWSCSNGKNTDLENDKIDNIAEFAHAIWPQSKVYALKVDGSLSFKTDSDGYFSDQNLLEDEDVIIIPPEVEG